jgi:hypothetical protein
MFKSKIEKTKKMFRLSKPEQIRISCLYLNLQNKLENFVVKDNYKIQNKDDLIYFISLNNENNGKHYTFRDNMNYIVKTKNHIDTVDLQTFSTSGVNSLEDADETVIYFHDLNEIIIVFQEKPRIQKYQKNLRATKKNSKRKLEKGEKRKMQRMSKKNIL